MYEEILVDKVICSELVCLTDCEKDIKIENVAIPEGSVPSGTVEVAVMECIPRIDKKDDFISACIKLFIQKELLIRTPDCREIKLEYGFRIERKVRLEKCSPCSLRCIDPCLLNDLECRVTDISIRDKVALHPSSSEVPTASFDDFLTVKLCLKLIKKKQIAVPVCPTPWCMPLNPYGYGYNPCFMPQSCFPMSTFGCGPCPPFGCAQTNPSEMMPDFPPTCAPAEIHKNRPCHLHPKKSGCKPCPPHPGDKPCCQQVPFPVILPLDTSGSKPCAPHAERCPDDTCDFMCCLLPLAIIIALLACK